MKMRLAIFVAGALVVAAATPAAWATNGMDMIGYGPRSIGMGGADVAVDGDASSVGGNPAVVSRLTPSSAAIDMTALMPQLTYADASGQSIKGKKETFFMPLLGYVHSLENSPLSIGIGAYAQGGMGVHFDNVNNGVRRDLLMSEVAFLRVNPLLAYKVSDDLSLGATVMLGYAKAKFSQFPNTFSAGPDRTPGTADDFGGIAVKDLWSFGYAGKIGVQYRIGDMVRVGATYLTPSKIDLGHGTATLQGPAGPMAYDAKLGSFTWPQEAEFGVAVLPAKGLTLAADVKWINWSATIDKPKLTVSNPPAGAPATPFPNASGAPMSSDSIVFDMGWHDQWVYAVGAEYGINAMHKVRVGFNLANNPVPAAKLNPLFPAIPTTHVTAGYGLCLGKWGVDLAYEHAFKKTVTNPGNARQPSFEVAHSQNTVSVGATYRY